MRDICQETQFAFGELFFALSVYFRSLDFFASVIQIDSQQCTSHYQYQQTAGKDYASPPWRSHGHIDCACAVYPSVRLILVGDVDGIVPGSESGQRKPVVRIYGRMFPPGTFTAKTSGGIRPRSAYLKVIGDFARWNDELVFGCDDSAQKEFLNKRKAKGGIEGPGQSNSNLWFTSIDKPDELGPATVDGAVWSDENVGAGEASEPYLFAGWEKRMGWIENQGVRPVQYVFEVDMRGNGEWSPLKTVEVDGGQSVAIDFPASDKGEWIRVKTDGNTKTTVAFTYTAPDLRGGESSEIFDGLSSVADDKLTGGLFYGLGDNRRSLGILAYDISDGEMEETGYYEMGDRLELVRKDDVPTADFIRSKFAISYQGVTVEESSVLIVDDSGRRWRLPLGADEYRPLTEKKQLRVCREVATERDLFSCMGTFYELPAENADGYAKIRPISSHGYRIHDYASYRGMLVMTGVKPEDAGGNEHIIVSEDGKAAVWAGTIDDLWQLGKPLGHGGPWKDTEVKAGVPSDPYLIGFYDRKELVLSHDSDVDVVFTIEVDPTGNGDWMQYKSVAVGAGKAWTYDFPEAFQARWIRFSTDADTRATAWLEYQ